MTLNDSFRNRSAASCRYEDIMNLTDIGNATEQLYTPIEDLFFTVVLPVIFITGLCGNAAFIYTVFNVKSMKTVTNTYLIHVAFADVMFVTLSSVPYAYLYHRSPIRYDISFRLSVGCVLLYFFPMTNYFASLLLITCVTIERYYAICQPLQHLMITGKSRTTKIIVASWVLGGVFGAAVVPRYSRLIGFCVEWPSDDDLFTSLPNQIHWCVEASPTLSLFADITQTAPLFLAMFVNLYMYVCIIVSLSRRPTMATSRDKTNVQTSQRVRNQVARLLIINGSMFFICQTPYRFTVIHNMMVYLTGSGFLNAAQYGALFVSGRCLILFNSCVNPIVYVTTSSIYRQAFHEAFMCRKQDKTVSG